MILNDEAGCGCGGKSTVSEHLPVDSTATSSEYSNEQLSSERKKAEFSVMRTTRLCSVASTTLPTPRNSTPPQEAKVRLKADPSSFHFPSNWRDLSLGQRMYALVSHVLGK